MAQVSERGAEKYLWIQYIKQRIRQNKNFVGIISGATGSGKSWTALSIGEMFDKNFSIDQVIFKGSDLLKLMNSGKLKKGSVIVWDEAGVDLSNRSWQTTTNKLLNFVLQTFRHKNFVLLFTTPYSDFVDKLTRKLFHAELKTVKINYEKRATKLKPVLIQYNSRKGKFYYKRLKVLKEGGGLALVSFWNVPAPSKKLVTQYEESKDQFTTKLNKEIEEELEYLENKKLRKKSNERSNELTDKQKEVLKLLENTNSIHKTASKLGISIQGVYAHVGAVKQKGYTVELGENIKISKELTA